MSLKQVEDAWEFCATGSGKSSLETKLIWIFLLRKSGGEGGGSRKKELVGIAYVRYLGFFNLFDSHTDTYI